MHPYRHDHNPAPPAPSAAVEELVVYLALLLIGSLPILGTVFQGGPFGVEPSLGAFMVVAGLAGLVSTRRSRG